MLNDEICKVRDKLNKSIEDGKSYDEIYKISVELDELIAQFYNKWISAFSLYFSVFAKKHLKIKKYVV